MNKISDVVRMNSVIFALLNISMILRNRLDTLLFEKSDNLCI